MGLSRRTQRPSLCPSFALRTETVAGDRDKQTTGVFEGQVARDNIVAATVKRHATINSALGFGQKGKSGESVTTEHTAAGGEPGRK